METMQTPGPNEYQSLLKRAGKFGQDLIAPHPSILELGLIRRAQLLNALALLLCVGFVFGLLLRPLSSSIFYFLLGVSGLSFILGKSKNPGAGTLLFSIGFISASYLALALGLATGYLVNVLTIIPMALIVASALTGQITFAGLVVFATVGTVLAPFYSKIPILQKEIPEAGGIVFFAGTILYGVILFRANLERSRLEDSRTINLELQEIKTKLEERVEERTHSLAKANRQIQERAMRLQTISEISQEISANLDQQSKEVLAHITRTISGKLDFYHVGIFLLDETREYAVLRAANSQGGQHMLERRHQLKVGGTGIVGYVSQAGRPRIALDTGSDAVFFNNPDLPKTRSEIALPLKYGTQVIGVLDVQSTLSSAFKDEDVNTLGTLANQVAVIINNIQFRDNPLSSGLKKTGKTLTRKQEPGGYSYLPDGTITTDLPFNSPMLEKALTSGETEITSQTSANNPPTLAVPVKFRGRVVGIIHIQAAEAGRVWTEDEIVMVQSISERAAFTLENARLFEETNRRAEQEETIARVTTQIGASTDFDRILQTTIQELGLALGVSRSFIQMGTRPENGNEKP